MLFYCREFRLLIENDKQVVARLISLDFCIVFSILHDGCSLQSWNNNLNCLSLVREGSGGESGGTRKKFFILA